MVSVRHAIVLIALTAAALASWYLARPGNGDDDTVPSFDATQQGYYLKSARILGTGSDGGLLYELRAEEAQQQEGGVIWVLGQGHRNTHAIPGSRPGQLSGRDE